MRVARGDVLGRLGALTWFVSRIAGADDTSTSEMSGTRTLPRRPSMSPTERRCTSSGKHDTPWRPHLFAEPVTWGSPFDDRSSADPDVCRDARIAASPGGHLGEALFLHRRWAASLKRSYV